MLADPERAELMRCPGHNKARCCARMAGSHTSSPPPKDRRILHGGRMLPVTEAIVAGVREMQRHRAPNLDVLLIAERQAERWLALMQFEVRLRLERRALAR